MQLSWWYKQLALSTWFLCNSGAADKCPVHLLTLPHVCLNGAVILFPRYLFSFTAHFARGQFWWISQLNDWQAHEHVYRGNISWCLNFSPWFVKKELTLVATCKPAWKVLLGCSTTWHVMHWETCYKPVSVEEECPAVVFKVTKWTKFFKGKVCM